MQFISRLTERELKIAVMTACGLSEKEIATKLSVSPHTVRVHVENIKRRLSAKNKTHAIAMLIAAGVISPEQIDGKVDNPQALVIPDDI